MAAVTYIFSNVPGGSSIPLAELDYNFSECINNTNFTSANIAGNLVVGGASNFTGLVTVNSLNMLSGGALTISGSTVSPTGTTGSGAMVFNISPSFVSPILGTPTSGTLTYCTGLPLGSITGLGSNVSAFLSNPTANNFRNALVGATGTGNVVFQVSPALITPDIGTPSAGDLTNCTNYPVANLNGTISIAQGGTGATTATTAINNLLPAQSSTTANKVLTSNGSTVSWQTNASGTVSSVAFSTGTTGLNVAGSPITTSGTFTLSGTLNIANGGTGATSRQAALNALAGGFGADKFLVGDGTNIVLANLTPAQIAAAGTLTNNTSGSAATFTSTNQNSQFNSIGVNTGPTGTPGQVNATSNFYTSNGNYIDGYGTLHPTVHMILQSPPALGPFLGIAPWANRITVMYFNVVTGAGSASPQIQVGTSSGVVTTGYISACTNIGAASEVSTSGFNLCYATPNTFNVVWTLNRIDANTWISSVQGIVGLGNFQQGTGVVSIASPITQIACGFNGGGTYTGGAINVSYE